MKYANVAIQTIISQIASEKVVLDYAIFEIIAINMLFDV